MSETPRTVYLKNYQPPLYEIPTVDIHFDLKEEQSLVTNRMTFVRNGKSTSTQKDLFLDGNNLELLEIKRSGQTLDPNDYNLDKKGLLLKNCPDQFDLETKVRLKPQENKAFSGLYRTKTVFCTQMEAQGFRRTTFFMDRPDILSKYKTTLVADQNRYPTLLSNGNLVSKKTLSGGRHQIQWEDPFPKPCYLFALVAGDLDWIEDTFTTSSGRNIVLKIFVNKGKKDLAHFAMSSLKQAMKWDEENFDLEYDLDIYNIVAVDDFNMGAMENKSLNIFNSKFVLASPQTITDDEYRGIQRVIGHEYFHNWTGNRVTCRDWFQLSLKEGLTVFRDQEFSSDMNSRAVKRIEDVTKLRTHQFPEDLGPMAHPVRPASYIAIDNFYTVTVYEKGAEVIRMLKNLLGTELFKKGVSKYFELFDGQAVTTDDWIFAMEEVSGRNLSQFKLWYDQAGTPEVWVQTQYHEENKSFEIKLKQNTKDPITGKSQKALVIPLKMGLLSKQGVPLDFTREDQGEGPKNVLELTHFEQSFLLTQVKEAPVLSIHREFSAPIHLHYERTEKQLLLLTKKDEDSFSRWEAIQIIYKNQILNNYNRLLEDLKPQTSSLLLQALSDAISDGNKDAALTAKNLEYPNPQYLSQSLSKVDPQLLTKAYDHLFCELSEKLHEALLQEYKSLQNKTLGNSPQEAALRSYKNCLLNLLYRHDENTGAPLFYDHFKNADNMTDSLAALHRLSVQGGKFYHKAMEQFYDQWKEDTLVMNKWLVVAALSKADDCFERIKEKTKDPVFNKTNPNHVFSLFYHFAKLNWARFHSKSGETYEWFADQILDVDSRNPQVSSRLASCLNHWKDFHEDYQKPMEEALRRILKCRPTDNLFEIVNKALQ